MVRAKEIINLDCEASAASGARLILRTRLEEMCALRAEALNWTDLEGVHNMRVASRRLRSALRDFQSLFRRRELRVFNKRLRSIAWALGAVRDKDVAIKALAELTAQAPIEVAEGIKSFAAEHNLAREQKRSALTLTITEDALIQLQAEFITGFEHAMKPAAAKDKAGDELHEEMSFRDAGQHVIRLRWEELQQQSASLYHPFDTEPLHDLRITAKRLRYALELFAECFGNESLLPFAKEVAELQTSLGEVHDCDEWIDWFGKRLDKSLERNVSLSHATNGYGLTVIEDDDQQRSAAVWLLGHFVKARTKHYRLALNRWHDWETTGFARRLDTTLATPSTTNALAEPPINNSVHKRPQRTRAAK